MSPLEGCGRVLSRLSQIVSVQAPVSGAPLPRVVTGQSAPRGAPSAARAGSGAWTSRPWRGGRGLTPAPIEVPAALVLLAVARASKSAPSPLAVTSTRYWSLI